MQNLRAYLTREGWKRDLDETIDDLRLVLGETQEGIKARKKAQLMERIMKHIGLPKGIIHRLDKLVAYCERNCIGYAPVTDELVAYCKENNTSFVPEKPENEGDICLLTRLGKARYQLTYDPKGNFKGLSADFLVETGGRPLIM